MAVLSAVFAALAVILSDVMCAVVAFNFCDMLWGIKYAGYSAPASVAFMTAVPYAVGIIICVILSLFLKKRA
jgi:uncharacterized membrane protein